MPRPQMMQQTEPRANLQKKQLSIRRSLKVEFRKSSKVQITIDLTAKLGDIIGVRKGQCAALAKFLRIRGDLLPRKLAADLASVLDVRVITLDSVLVARDELLNKEFYPLVFE